MILYVHGFASSGGSFKGRRLKEAFGADNVLTPTLPPVPDEAVALLEGVVAGLKERGEEPLLVGSSLGGFYSLYLCAGHGLPAVLVNPAVKAPETLRRAVGVNRNFTTGETFLWTEEHAESLGRYDVRDVARLDQERIMLIVQTGDQLLDYRDAVALLPRAAHLVIEGGTHEFERFEDVIGPIGDFHRRVRTSSP